MLCNLLRRLYDWKYALIAPRVYFGPRYLAKNNTSQNKAGVMWTRSNLRCLWRGFCLPLKCPVPKLQCCHNEVLPCNYPAVRYTQQPSRESAENSVCVLQCHAVNRTAWLYSGRPSPEVARAWWIMERQQLHQYCNDSAKHAAYWHQPTALTANVFLINAEPSCSFDCCRKHDGGWWQLFLVLR